MPKQPAERWGWLMPKPQRLTYQILRDATQGTYIADQDLR